MHLVSPGDLSDDDVAVQAWAHGFAEDTIRPTAAANDQDRLPATRRVEIRVRGRPADACRSRRVRRWWRVVGVDPSDRRRGTLLGLHRRLLLLQRHQHVHRRAVGMREPRPTAAVARSPVRGRTAHCCVRLHRARWWIRRVVDSHEGPPGRGWVRAERSEDLHHQRRARPVVADRRRCDGRRTTIRPHDVRSRGDAPGLGYGPRARTMGWRASTNAEVFIDDCSSPTTM